MLNILILGGIMPEIHITKCKRLAVPFSEITAVWKEGKTVVIEAGKGVTHRLAFAQLAVSERAFDEIVEKWEAYYA
jgi:hypothetical protein